jgi:hypothetical protein
MNFFKWQREILRSPEGSGGGSEGTPGGGSSAPSSAPSSAGSTSPAPSSSPSGAPSSPSPTPSSSPSPSAPAPTPAAAPAGKEPARPSPLADDPFAGFGLTLDDDSEQIPVQTQPAPPVQPEPTAPAPAPEPAAPAAPPGPASQPGPQEAMPQAPSPAEPARMARQLLENVESLADHMAATAEFQLTEADLEAINTDVTTAIPKLLARQYVRSQAAALSQMERVVPAIIERYMRVTEARTKSEGRFYERWPSIQKSAHGSVVDRLAQTYRRENPQATLDQMVEDLGPIVMMVARINPQAQQAAPQPNGRSGDPMSRAAKAPPPSPFQPAMGGPASPPAHAPANPWDGYGAVPDDE